MLLLLSIIFKFTHIRRCTVDTVTFKSTVFLLVLTVCFVPYFFFFSFLLAPCNKMFGWIAFQNSIIIIRYSVLSLSFCFFQFEVVTFNDDLVIFPGVKKKRQLVTKLLS